MSRLHNSLKIDKENCLGAPFQIILIVSLLQTPNILATMSAEHTTAPSEPTVIPKRYTYVRMPQMGSELNLVPLSRQGPILLAPFSIHPRFKVIWLGHNITVLEKDVIGPGVETLIVREFTEDMVLPDTLKVLIIIDPTSKMPIPKVPKVMIPRLDKAHGLRLDTHWIYRCNYPLDESDLERDLYDIEELNIEINICGEKVYTAKRIPKPKAVPIEVKTTEIEQTEIKQTVIEPTVVKATDAKPTEVKPSYPYPAGDYLDLGGASPHNMALIDRIPEQFTRIRMGVNTSWLKKDILHSKIETLVVIGSVRDLILPEGIVNLVVANLEDAEALIEVRPKVTNLFIHTYRHTLGDQLGDHHLYSFFPVGENEIQRHLYHIEDENIKLCLDSETYYTVKRIPLNKVEKPQVIDQSGPKVEVADQLPAQPLVQVTQTIVQTLEAVTSVQAIPATVHDQVMIEFRIIQESINKICELLQ